ncbi:MAG: response regulator [Bacteroidetes bacterium]|jgi:two-component system, cell cycle response regulator DivK|nr:response regulator [Bacteroidota bacterium]
MSAFQDNIIVAEPGSDRYAIRNKHVNWLGKTILIVEDTTSNFQLLETYLSRTGVNIIHVDNGYKALEILENKETIDLIVMDIRLPEMNGLIATRKIREKNSSIPIIAQTAYAMDTDRELCLNAGCNEFIPKPFRKHELIDVMANYL